MYRHILALPLALLLGCGLAAPGPGPVDASPTILLAPTMPATPPVSDTSAPAVDAALPAGWQRVPWQGLSIPLPPEATGIEPFHTTTSDATHNLPLLASGMVAFPPPTPEGGAIGEYPLPPTFTLLEFPGTLADWIALEEQITPGEDGGVMEPNRAATHCRSRSVALSAHRPWLQL